MTPKELALSVVRDLRGRGHTAYWAGGCVRDRLLGRDPADYDVATDARPEQIQSYFPGSLGIGTKFGVVLVREGEARVEVATFRREGEYHDGRRPCDVRFTDNAEQDAGRRDFTVNGLFFDPIEERCLDYVGGREDLSAGLIRAIGDPEQRLAEDKLRMLRAVRFAARLGFSIETETHRAIESHSTEILEISAERIRDELNAMLTEGAPHKAFALLDETGLLEAVLPEAARMRGVPQSPEHHPEGDVWTHTLLLLEHLETPTVTLAWGALLHDVGKPDTMEFSDRIRFHGHVEVGVKLAEGILTRLRFSNQQIERILALVANHMRFAHVTEMRTGRLKRFLRTDGFEEHMELHRLDCVASHGKLRNYDFVRRKLAEIPEPELRPPRLVRGDDLIAAGYSPGPVFAEILEWLEIEQLEGAVATKDQALAKLRERYPLPHHAE